jgi:hypothetical protein
MLALTFYTTRFSRPEFAGRAFGPVIVIKPEYRNDRGLLEHEREHVRQFWSHFPVHGLLYALSKKYRLRMEVLAYRKQLLFYPDDRTTLFAGYIASKYGLNITGAQAYELLRG